MVYSDRYQMSQQARGPQFSKQVEIRRTPRSPAMWGRGQFKVWARRSESERCRAQPARAKRKENAHVKISPKRIFTLPNSALLGFAPIGQRLGSLEAKETGAGGPGVWGLGGGGGCVTDQIDECRGGSAKI